MILETKENHGVVTASDRSFGFTFGVVFVLIVIYRFFQYEIVNLYDYCLMGMSVLLFLLALTKPQVLSWPNRIWTKVGLLLFMVVNPLVMLVIYISTIVPIGLLLKCFKKDPLLRNWDKNAKSYWIDREATSPKPEGLRNQF